MCSGIEALNSMQRDRHARKHVLQTWYVAAVEKSVDVDPGVVGWHRATAQWQ